MESPQPIDFEHIKKKVGAIFSERLVKAREDKGLSQSRLTMLTGIAQSQISRYEGNHNVPTPACTVVLASALGVSVDHLYGMDALKGVLPRGR